MAGNKFATMLHRNTNKVIVILVYALLEWILIALLLLNSLFTYLITKFAHYFGLKQPCTWCSRVDHVLEPVNTSQQQQQSHHSHRYTTLCESHATEISKLSYCSNHKRLAETHNMCIDCLASRPNHNENNLGITQRVNFFTWVSTEKLDNGDEVETVLCSCCNQSLSSSKVYSSYSLFKPSWGVLDYAERKGLVLDVINDANTEKSDSLLNCCEEDDGNGEEEEVNRISVEGSASHDDHLEDDDDDEEEEEECSRTNSSLQSEEKEADDGVSAKFVHQFADDDIIIECCREDDSMGMIERCCIPEKYMSYDSHDRLIPIEMIDASTTANFKHEVEFEKQHYLNENSDAALVTETCAGVSVESALHVNDETEEEIDAEAREISEKNMEVTEISAEESNQDLVGEPSVVVPDAQPSKHSSVVDNDAQVSDSVKLSIVENDFGVKELEMSAEQNESRNQEGKSHDLAVHTESYEVEEEKFPETPTSMDNFHYLHKKLLLAEKRESGIEDSLDGSVVNGMEFGDPVQTVDRLKTALKAERKALSALYAELEEERSASAVSTSQTMAMINRLQEEKAAMRMEALQYQRMMEEQAEYDQEALQLMNELVVKREKEKEELERELEIYRKKVLDYETKEKIRQMKRIKDIRSGNSSASYGNEEETEELSIDLNRQAKDEDCSSYSYIESINNMSPAEAVLNLEEVALDCVTQIGNLDESLVEFDEERMAILGQIKALEEKILTLGDSELVDGQQSLEHKDFDENQEFSSPDDKNGVCSGFSMSMDKCFTMSSMVKNLLPLLDAAEDYEAEENFSNEEKVMPASVEIQESLDSKFKALDSKKIELEEEVDHVYERLQALEADREFLKHCVSSISQGDKGMDLLHEILQHLRDLKAVELRLKNMNDDDTLQ